MPEPKRLPTSIDDIPKIREQSRILWERLEHDLPLWSQDYPEIQWIHSESGEFPKRIVFQDSKKNPYSVIISDMGSLTLRPEFGKKQAIFYMSIGRYGSEKYLWEDEYGNEIHEGQIPSRFLDAILTLRKYS